MAKSLLEIQCEYKRASDNHIIQTRRVTYKKYVQDLIEEMVENENGILVVKVIKER
jgi:hypothetical protein